MFKVKIFTSADYVEATMNAWFDLVVVHHIMQFYPPGSLFLGFIPVKSPKLMVIYTLISDIPPEEP